MKVFQIDECSWYAALTKDEAIAAYTNDMGITRDELLSLDELAGCLHELDDREMSELVFNDIDCDLFPSGGKCTFEEALEAMIKRGEKFPCPFASTQY